MFEVIKRYKPTISTTVPTMINSMLNVPGASAEDVSSLRFLLFRLAKRCRKNFTNVG